MQKLIDRLIQLQDINQISIIINCQDFNHKTSSHTRKKLQKIYSRLIKYCSSPLFWTNLHQQIKNITIALVKIGLIFSQRNKEIECKHVSNLIQKSTQQENKNFCSNPSIIKLIMNQAAIGKLQLCFKLIKHIKYPNQQFTVLLKKIDWTKYQKSLTQFICQNNYNEWFNFLTPFLKLDPHSLIKNLLFKGKYEQLARLAVVFVEQQHFIGLLQVLLQNQIDIIQVFSHLSTCQKYVRRLVNNQNLYRSWLITLVEKQKGQLIKILLSGCLNENKYQLHAWSNQCIFLAINKNFNLNFIQALIINPVGLMGQFLYKLIKLNHHFIFKIMAKSIWKWGKPVFLWYIKGNTLTKDYNIQGHKHFEFLLHQAIIPMFTLSLNNIININSFFQQVEDSLLLLGIYLQMYAKWADQQYQLLNFNQKALRFRQSYRKYLRIQFTSAVKNSYINQNTFDNKFDCAEHLIVNQFNNKKSYISDLGKLIVDMIQSQNLRYLAGLLRLGCRSKYGIDKKLLKNVIQLIEHKPKLIVSQQLDDLKILQIQNKLKKQQRFFKRQIIQSIFILLVRQKNNRQQMEPDILIFIKLSKHFYTHDKEYLFQHLFNLQLTQTQSHNQHLQKHLLTLIQSTITIQSLTQLLSLSNIIIDISPLYTFCLQSIQNHLSNTIIQNSSLYHLLQILKIFKNILSRSQSLLFRSQPNPIFQLLTLLNNKYKSISHDWLYCCSLICQCIQILKIDQKGWPSLVLIYAKLLFQQKVQGFKLMNIRHILNMASRQRQGQLVSIILLKGQQGSDIGCKICKEMLKQLKLVLNMKDSQDLHLYCLYILQQITYILIKINFVIDYQKIIKAIFNINTCMPTLVLQLAQKGFLSPFQSKQFVKSLINAAHQQTKYPIYLFTKLPTPRYF